LSLRERSTLGALRALRAKGHISADVESDMVDAYRFLRTLEHRLQMIDDQQTHTLPKVPAELEHIAGFMGYRSRSAFEDALRGKLSAVQGHYARLFEREAPLAAQLGSLVFTGVEEDPETLATLSRMGFERGKDISAVIRGWHHGRIRATRSARARELLTRLMPALLEALAKTADPDAAFTHFDRFLSGLPAGVQVFSMLFANLSLLDLVAEIAGFAPRLADYLGRNPGVLDALTDPGFLTRIPSPEELGERFAAEVDRATGYEAALDVARRFAKEEKFRIGVQVIEGLANAEAAGPAYAAIAETVIAGLQKIVERDMETVHGRIAGGAFVVVALGKLGGREMTAASDLDLVFIYDHDADVVQSDGLKPLAPPAYFARMSQRFIAALTALTAEGRLYEVDMRLRPSGNQGPVAVRFATFVEYHRKEAWTWERMALTRARVLSGPPTLQARVEDVICSVFTESLADPVQVKNDARTMRDKLAAQFPGRDIWDIKFAPGGLVDIEFIVQTWQLIAAPKDVSILDQNIIRALEKFAAACPVNAGDTEALIAAARLEHGLTQVLRIALDVAFRPASTTKGLKVLLARAGAAPDFSTVEEQLKDTEAKVRAIFERSLPPLHSAGNSTSAPGDQAT
jgi:glutamate-ammonia-ligase adenylyltransferase